MTIVKSLPGWVATVFLVLAVVSGLLIHPMQAHGQASEKLPSVIDPRGPFSLTVVKSAGDPGTAFGDPSNPNADLDRTPIAGAKFEIRRVGDIDLTTNKGWNQATKLSDHPQAFFKDGASRSRLEAPVGPVTTDKDGRAVFSDIKPGLYLVEEVPSEAAYQRYVISRPFFTFVPDTDETGERWIYDMTAYAKPEALDVAKTAEPYCSDGTKETVKFGFSTSIPFLDGNRALQSFEIADPLQKGLTLIDDSVRLTTSTRSGNTPTAELDKADYTLAVDGDNVLRIRFSDGGRAKLAELRDSDASATIDVVFEAKVDPAVTEVTNQAYLLPNGFPSFDLSRKPGIVSNPARVKIIPCGTPTPTPTTSVSTTVSTATTTATTTSSDRETVTTTSVPPTTPPPTIHVPVTATVERMPDPVKSTVTVAKTPGETPERPQGPLASTGANVLWVALAGLVFILLGLAFSRRKRED